MTKEIRFYKVPDPYGYFSNFSRHPIHLDGKMWPTTEHYYQAYKFLTTEPEYAEEIRLEPSPFKVQKMGNDRDHRLREDWEEIKYAVMLKALEAKFGLHEDCAAMLRSTQDMTLIEDTGQGPDDDHIWGAGSTGQGKNLLGKALMEVRAAMRDNTEDFLRAEIGRVLGTEE